MQRRADSFVRIAKAQLRRAGPAPCTVLIAVLIAVLTAALGACPLHAAALPDQTGNPASNNSQASTTAHKPVHARKHPAAKPSPAAPANQAAPVPPPAPPRPNWPVNDKPVDATVVWDSHGLLVDASNSRLDQILKEISTDTGAKVDGLGTSDVRIFGTYGPGPANEVISQLLNGTGYNVLIIGDQGAGAPRQIVLSSPPSGAAPQNAAHSSNDDDAEPDPPAPMEQPNPVNGFAPPQPRTPQQIQEMQLRQEQIQQQLRQQMINQQQQPPQPPDTAAPPQ